MASRILAGGRLESALISPETMTLVSTMQNVGFTDTFDRFAPTLSVLYFRGC